MQAFWKKKSASRTVPAEGWRILLVCMGNICRSPMAEGVLRHRSNEAGLGALLQFDSAGTHAYHAGEPPDERAQMIARATGIELGGLRARPVNANDFQDFDWILAMDKQNLLLLRQECPADYRHKVQLFLEFAGCGMDEVPDPYYGNLDGFREVLARCERGATGIISRYRAAHPPAE